MKIKSLLFSIVLVTMASCQSDAQKVEVLAPKDFADIMSKTTDYQLVDVRTPNEYDMGHLEGAELINFMADSFESEISKLDKNKPVLVYCAVGGRSGQAASKLKKLGFTQIYDLNGGMNAWNASNMKVVTD
jgi:rhodanese-related sulfurtransferase